MLKSIQTEFQQKITEPENQFKSISFTEKNVRMKWWFEKLSFFILYPPPYCPGKFVQLNSPES